MSTSRIRALRRFAWPVCAGLAALLAAPEAFAQSVSDPNLSVSALLPEFSLAAPTTMAFLGPDDILVLEKNTGNVQRILNGALLGPVLTVPVDGLNERGLLGIAVNTETPPKVFLYYSEAATPGGSALGNRVYRYTWNPNTGVLESPLRILDLPVLPGANHNGGVLLLGPPSDGAGVGDGGYLYASIGDLNHNGQLQNVTAGPAPDDTSVILRVKQDGTPAAGNPFKPYCSAQPTLQCNSNGDCGANGPCLTQVARYYAYGMRNCFGMTRDSVTGRVWLSENGPGNYDEVDRLVAGMNGGWNQIIGPVSRDAQGTSDLWNMPGAGDTYHDPEFSWLTPLGMTGIVLPRGSRLGAAYDDVAIVGEVNLGQLYALPLNSARTGFDPSGASGVSDLVADSSGERDQFRIGSGFEGITDLKIGPDKKLYVVSIYNATIYRIDGPGSTSGSGGGPSSAPRAPDVDLRELGRRLGDAASEGLGGPP
jgi:glucose/arabinose dehydrogenase